MTRLHSLVCMCCHKRLKVIVGVITSFLIVFPLCLVAASSTNTVGVVMGRGSVEEGIQQLWEWTKGNATWDVIKVVVRFLVALPICAGLTFLIRFLVPGVRRWCFRHRRRLDFSFANRVNLKDVRLKYLEFDRKGKSEIVHQIYAKTANKEVGVFVIMGPHKSGKRMLIQAECDPRNATLFTVSWGDWCECKDGGFMIREEFRSKVRSLVRGLSWGRKTYFHLIWEVDTLPLNGAFQGLVAEFGDFWKELKGKHKSLPVAFIMQIPAYYTDISASSEHPEVSFLELNLLDFNENFDLVKAKGATKEDWDQSFGRYLQKRCIEQGKEKEIVWRCTFGMPLGAVAFVESIDYRFGGGWEKMREVIRGFLLSRNKKNLQDYEKKWFAFIFLLSLKDKLEEMKKLGQMEKDKAEEKKAENIGEFENVGHIADVLGLDHDDVACGLRILYGKRGRGDFCRATTKNALRVDTAKMFNDEERVVRDLLIATLGHVELAESKELDFSLSLRDCFKEFMEKDAPKEDKPAEIRRRCVVEAIAISVASMVGTPLDRIERLNRSAAQVEELFGKEADIVNLYRSVVSEQIFVLLDFCLIRDVSFMSIQEVSNEFSLIERYAKANFTLGDYVKTEFFLVLSACVRGMYPVDWGISFTDVLKRVKGNTLTNEQWKMFLAMCFLAEKCYEYGAINHIYEETVAEVRREVPSEILRLFDRVESRLSEARVLVGNHATIQRVEELLREAAPDQVYRSLLLCLCCRGISFWDHHLDIKNSLNSILDKECSAYPCAHRIEFALRRDAVASLLSVSETSFAGMSEEYLHECLDSWILELKAWPISSISAVRLYMYLCCICSHSLDVRHMGFAESIHSQVMELWLRLGKFEGNVAVDLFSAVLTAFAEVVSRIEDESLMRSFIVMWQRYWRTMQRRQSVSSSMGVSYFSGIRAISNSRIETPVCNLVFVNLMPIIIDAHLKSCLCQIAGMSSLHGAKFSPIVKYGYMAQVMAAGCEVGLNEFKILNKYNEELKGIQVSLVNRQRDEVLVEESFRKSRQLFDKIVEIADHVIDQVKEVAPNRYVEEIVVKARVDAIEWMDSVISKYRNSESEDSDAICQWYDE